MSSRRVTVPLVVGVHVMEYGVPAGTMLVRPGSMMGLPTGAAPVGVVQADTTGMRQARPAVKRLKSDEEDILWYVDVLVLQLLV